MILTAAASRAVRVVVLAILCLFAIGASARADDSVVLNGDLAKGSGNRPDHWKTDAWKNESSFSTYTWTHNPGAPAELEISSVQPNDARWAQSLHLGPGWYHFTAEIRAEGVGENPNTGGACLSVLEDGIVSQQLRGTTNWQNVGFYLKVGQASADVQIACRLGGFASLNTGKVFCRNLQGVKVAEAFAGATTYDLDQIRGIAPAPAKAAASHASNAGLMILIALATLLVVGLIEGRRILDAFSSVGAPKPRPSRPRREFTSESHFEPVETAREEELYEQPPPPEEELPDEEILEEEEEPPEEPAAPRAYKLPSYLPTVVVTIAVLFVVLLAIRRLDGTNHTLNIAEGLRGIGRVLPDTGFAALKLWLFWALSTAVVAGLLLQFAPQMELFDVILAGAAGVWVIACVLGQLLGPIHLFRPLTIWLLVAAGIYQIWRDPPRLQWAPLTIGKKLGLLAVGLMSIAMLPLQLGSPVSPYMDVLSYPASVQRILSFGVYLPFDNDPFGCWGPRTQTPGLELFFATIAMASHVRLGVLAQSGLTVPMMALLILATYRLGATLANDTAGGMAALFLFFTTIFRRSTGMRGTAVDFALVALGLAFFLDRRRSRDLMAIGALIIGTSIIVHAIDGGLGLMVAGLGVLLWLGERDWERFITGLLCLAGAILFAVPEFAIGLARPLHYPILPFAQIAGAVVIVWSAFGMSERAETQPSWIGTWPNKVLVILLMAAIMYVFATTRDSLFEQLMGQFPILFMLAFAGLVLWAALEGPLASSNGAGIIAFAFLIAVILPGILRELAELGVGEAFSSGVNDIGYKLEEYWCPYFLVFPAAIPFALLYGLRRRTRLVAVLALLVLLIYPWYLRSNVSDDYTEHSISEEWSIGFGTAAGGFWFLTHNPRWTMGPADFALVDFLRGEQAAGRITTDTHILHIARNANVTGDFNHFAVFTGINDDPMLYDIPATDVGWFAGGRVRPMDELHEALAKHPAYILEQVPPPSWMKQPPDGYEEVFHQDSLRLFRRKVS